MSVFAKCIAGSVGLLGLIAPAAAQVTPVGVTASSTFVTYDLIDLINDSGLSAGLHDNQYFNMWMSDSEVLPSLTFDLGAEYVLTGAQVWQYNFTDFYDRGVQTFDILVSTDGVTYTPAGSGSLVIADGQPTPAQAVAFTGTARYVRFDVTTNFGSSGYTGLSEVKFDGTVVPVELQSFGVE